MIDAVDVFAGPGGWEVAARRRGLSVVGVELDHDACRTAVAAGQLRVRADVRTIPLEPFAGVRGVIGSPPCPTFSTTGTGTGRHDLPLLLAAIKRLGAGEWPAEELAECDDDRTALTVEPLRWVLALRPEWTAWEQVPAVGPVWEASAEVLAGAGYSVWTGRLHAEEYGVPQTRTRDVLLASRVRRVGPPRCAAPVTIKQALDRAGLAPAGVAIRSNYGTGGDARRRGVRTWDQQAATVTGKCGRAKWLDLRGNVVRGMTVQEAGVLQTFPADYPWTGRDQQLQVGNAVPPLLALACLEAVT